MSGNKEPTDWWPIGIAIMFLAFIALAAFEQYMNYLRDLNNVPKVEQNEGK